MLRERVTGNSNSQQIDLTVPPMLPRANLGSTHKTELSTAPLDPGSRPCGLQSLGECLKLASKLSGRTPEGPPLHPPKLVAGSGSGSAVVAKSRRKSEPCFLEALES